MRSWLRIRDRYAIKKEYCDKRRACNYFFFNVQLELVIQTEGSEDCSK